MMRNRAAVGMLVFMIISAVSMMNPGYYSKPDKATRIIIPTYEFSYSSKDINMTITVSLKYAFTIEYTSIIPAGTTAKVSFKASAVEVSLEVDILLVNKNISFHNISGELKTTTHTTLDLGFDIEKYFMGVGELAVCMEDAGGKEYLGGRFQITGLMTTLKNIIKGTTTIYGDALEGEGGVEEYIVVSENSSFARDIDTKGQGNITILANLGVVMTTPNITLETLSLYLDNGETYSLDLGPYSNFTVSSVEVMQAGGEKQHMFEPISIVIWVVPRSELYLRSALPVIAVVIVIVIVVLPLVLGKIKGS